MRERAVFQRKIDLRASGCTIRHALRYAQILVVSLIFGLALYLLQKELRHVHWADIRHELATFPLSVLGLVAAWEWWALIR